ncbi:MAG: hypothetical protein CM1200mP32_09070 [Methanobacteriota archaeon]|nr:MAG: hypothetical protein CM1200mP32_09070 [Euryarchaeota archaeon]
MILNRSMGEGLPLMEWLETSVFPVEKGLTAEFVEVGTRAAVAEMISTGATFACDMYYHPDVVAGVLVESGVRGVSCGPKNRLPHALVPIRRGRGIAEKGCPAQGKRAFREGRFWNRHPLGLHLSEETLLKASEMAAEHGACSTSTPARLARRSPTAMPNTACTQSSTSTP